MRDSSGRLISVWSPGNHGAGGSTMALAVGIALQHLLNRKTLILNMGCAKNYMEQYIKNDADVRFSMDYLKSFDMGIRAEHILTYASAVNDMLYVLPNSKISSEVNKVGERFFERFIQESLKAFDFVIVDLGNGLNKENQLFLDRSDIIVGMMNENVLMLKDVFDDSTETRRYLYSEKALPVFNTLHCDEPDSKCLSRLNKRLGLSNSFGFSYDSNASKAACFDGKLYSFLKKELTKNKAKSLMAIQIMELCNIIFEKLLIHTDSIQENTRFVSMLFSKVKLWGELDV